MPGWASDSPTPAQLKEFFAQIERSRITRKKLQAFLRGEPVSIGLFGLLFEWQTFYRDLFGLEMDFSGLSVPGRKEGFDRLIVVAQGMTRQQLYQRCGELFPCRRGSDQSLNNIVRSRQTSKKGHYAVWFRDTVEADEGLKNLSAYELKERNIPGITLEERFLMELKYFEETDQHLDIENATLCSDSRYLDGSGVPLVHWDSRCHELCVDECHPESSRFNLRSRQAVR